MWEAPYLGAEGYLHPVKSSFPWNSMSRAGNGIDRFAEETPGRPSPYSHEGNREVSL